MALIKGDSAATVVKEAIVLDLGDLGRQAARLTAAAKEKAARIARDAEDHARRLIESASNVGYEQGLAKGKEEGLKQGMQEGRAQALQESAEQLRQLQEVWMRAAAQWESDRERLQSEARQAVLELTIKLTDKIVHRVIELDQTVVVDQLDGALSAVLSSTDVTVRICPDDRAVVTEALPQLCARLTHLGHIELVDDPAITPGGCSVTYGQGRVDATLETQLARLADLMLPDQSSQNPNRAEADPPDAKSGDLPP